MKVWEVKKVIYNTEIVDYLRDGMAVSDPLPILQNDRLVDAYLVYYVNVKKNTMSEPVFTFIIDTAKGKLLSVEKWNSSIRKHEKATEILISCETIEMRKKAKEEYECLYPKMREFFYKEHLPAEIKKQMQQFYHAFCLYSGERKVYYYKQAVPEFFRWIESIR